jgi:RNA polymerase sigma-70 factor, ECF subfamily
MPTVNALALDEGARWKPGPVRGDTLERRLEQHRAELTVFCRRMLGSSDAEDAVQETLVKAWRGFDCFEGRAALRSWLYRIAANVCLDDLRTRQRRARCIEMMARDLARGLAAQEHATPVGLAPTGGAVGALGNPAETALAREALGLALATLMRLPPRQRAVLILRDVLRWKAVEVAELLDMTAGSVNSVLQRARSTLAARRPTRTDPRPPEEVTQRAFLARYVDAFERYDLEVLCSVLREDARRTSAPRRNVVVDRAPRSRSRARYGSH